MSHDQFIEQVSGKYGGNVASECNKLLAGVPGDLSSEDCYRVLNQALISCQPKNLATATVFNSHIVKVKWRGRISTAEA